MAIERPERLRKPSSGMAPELKFLLTSLSPIQCMDCRFAFISGWMMFKLRPIFDNNNGKIVNFVKSKNIFSSFDLTVSENWPLVSQCRCQNDSQFLGKKPERVPVFIRSGKTVLSDGVSNYKHQNIKCKIWLNTTVVFRSILATILVSSNHI